MPDPKTLQADAEEFATLDAKTIDVYSKLMNMGALSTRSVIERLWGPQSDDVILPYRQAFAELNRRKNSGEFAQHTMTKVNSGQWKVSSVTDISISEKAWAEELFKK